MASRKERRVFRRWDCMMPCRCVGEGFSVSGYIVNLLYGGAGIAGTRKLSEEGLELLLTIRRPKERIEPTHPAFLQRYAKGNGTT